MGELRRDPTSNDWVVFSTDRAKRPQAPLQKTRCEELPPFEKSCPFCPGNESRTPPELYRHPVPNGNPDWLVRVVPNAFPALASTGTAQRTEEGRLFHRMDAFGAHEVVIETPAHNIPMALLDYGHIEQVMKAYLERYKALSRNRSLKYITIFRNQGLAAGTSLAHPHSQLVATPVASPAYRKYFEIAVDYYDDVGKCLYCDMLRQEKERGVRVVAEADNFLVFHPYASHSAYETWIAPLEHSASFGCIGPQHVPELAGVLKDALLAIRRGLDDPDFNLMFLTSTTDDEDDPYYHWHIRIVPRLTTLAGFELGSGMRINTMYPEDTARMLRDLWRRES